MPISSHGSLVHILLRLASVGKVMTRYIMGDSHSGATHGDMPYNRLAAAQSISGTHHLIIQMPIFIDFSYMVHKLK